jgi:hypothetical protein
MAQVLTNQLRLQLALAMTEALDKTTRSAPINATMTLADLASGTGLNKADKRFTDSRTLASGVSETISMYNLAINGGAAGVDDLGDAALFATIKELIIVNTSTAAGEKLTIGGEGSGATWNSPFAASDTGQVTCGPGGHVMFGDPSSAGMAVANTTNHLLKIKNDGSNSITYDIYIIGASA